MQEQFQLHVEDTNEEALASKISATRKGYLKDDYAQDFVSFKGKRDVIIHRGYWARVYLFWNLIEQFLAYCITQPNLAKETKVQIVSLGAGLDTLYFNLLENQQQNQNYTFLELDLPSVVNKKIAKIQNSEKIQNLLKRLNSVQLNEDKSVLNAGNGAFTLRACDLTDLAAFKQTLASSGIDYKLPTLFFCECVISYIDPDRIDELLQNISSSFDLSFFLSYQMFNPKDRFGEMMLKNFADRGIPLIGMQKYPLLPDHKQRFLNSGFANVQIYNMLKIYNQILDKTEKSRIQKLEPIDEFQEWNIMMGHYFGLLASNIKQQAKANPLYVKIYQNLHIKK